MHGKNQIALIVISTCIEKTTFDSVITFIYQRWRFYINQNADYLNVYVLIKLYKMKKILLTLALSSISTFFLSGQTDTATFTKTGDPAPTFTCKTIDGKTIDISKLHGKVIMINFFATWCPPCNQELPVLQKEIWDKYRDNPDFVLIILGREHSEQEVKDFVARKKFTMLFAPDPKRAIFKLYARQNIPRNVIIGKDGKILFQSIGYTEEEFKKVENALASALKKA
jgi:peroxiredoxin